MQKNMIYPTNYFFSLNATTAFLLRFLLNTPLEIEATLE